MVDVISKNAWSIITKDLKVKDLLELRRTCKRLNDVIVNMNARWYKAHQWFVTKHCANSKVKSAVRVHRGNVNYRCFIYKMTNHLHLNWHQRVALINGQIEDGTLTEQDCTEQICYYYKVPQKEQEVPLDKNFKGKSHKYIYWYLIEAFRYYRNQHMISIRKCKRDIEKERNNIKYHKRQIEGSEKYIDRLKTQKKRAKLAYSKNEIFEGVRINGYKG